MIQLFVKNLVLVTNKNFVKIFNLRHLFGLLQRLYKCKEVPKAMSTQSGSIKNSITQYISAHQSDFYILAYGYVKNKDAALDIVQESIVKALSSAHQLKDENALKTWFYRIVVHTSISYLRKSKKVIYLGELPDSPVQEAVNKAELLDLYTAIDQLEPKLKSIIILRYFEDLKMKEIAYITNSPLSTVKSRVYIALGKLRDIMKGVN